MGLHPNINYDAKINIILLIAKVAIFLQIKIKERTRHIIYTIDSCMLNLQTLYDAQWCKSQPATPENVNL